MQVMTSDKPLLIFGMGAQKAGTTWLWNHFHSNGLIARGLPKEIHAWRSSRPLFLLSEAARKARFEDKKSMNALKQALICTQMAEDVLIYRNMFFNLAQSSGLPVADFTPENSLLDAGELKRIYDILSEAFVVHVIFIMRDPVDRLYSWCKHRTRRLRGHRDFERLTAEEAFILDLVRIESLGDFPLENQSNYRRTIQNIDASIDKESCTYLFYEELFCCETIISLSESLGLQYKIPDLGIRINSCSSGDGPPSELVDRAVQIHEPVYAFVRDRFGCYPEKWRALPGV
jgi:hypothetical protein